MNNQFSYVPCITSMSAILCGSRVTRPIFSTYGLQNEEIRLLVTVLWLLTIVASLISIFILQEKSILLYIIIIMSLFALVLAL